MHKNLVIALVLAISVSFVLVFDTSRTVSATQDPAASGIETANEETDKKYQGR